MIVFIINNWFSQENYLIKKILFNGGWETIFYKVVNSTHLPHNLFFINTYLLNHLLNLFANSLQLYRNLNKNE